MSTGPQCRAWPHVSAVSEDTIRRDLRDLQSMNLVRKTHGGVLRHIVPPAAFEKRVVIESELKTALGARAAELVGGWRRDHHRRRYHGPVGRALAAG